MPEKPRASLRTLLEALDFVSTHDLEDNEAFVNRRTGEVVWSSPNLDLDELPGDLDEPGLYVAVPNRYDLDLDQRAVLRFVAEQVPEQYDDVARMFQSRGAYRRFRGWLEARGKLDDWYAFEQARTEDALREWCADEGLALAEQ